MPDNDVPRRPALEKTPGEQPLGGEAAAPATATAGARADSSATAAPTASSGATTVEPAGERGRGAKRRAPLWLETVVLLAIALGMALIIKTFLVQAFYIPSASMEPGLVVNDRILVQKVSYWGDDVPERGDVVVFEDPGSWLTGPETGPQTVLSKGLATVGLYPTGGHLVKRVIGVPGDTVECCDDQGRLLVNGFPLDADSFIVSQRGCDGPMPFGQNGCRRGWTVTVPPDRLFVMGDNRSASEDSSARLCAPRAEGCDTERPFVPVDNVVGKVFSLVWPLSRAELIGRPEVFEDVPDPR